MTLSQSDWELLHREVDGETSEAEKAELQERLSREPELQKSYEALLGVGQSLSQVGLTDPPPELAWEVMRQVRQRHAARDEGWAGWLTGWVTRQPAMALASSLAVGLLGGLVVMSLAGYGPRPMDGSAVSGTLLRADHLQGLPVADEALLETPAFQARALARRDEDVVVTELAVSGGPVDVIVTVDETVLHPRGFECLGDDPKGGVTIEAGEVRMLQVPAGRCYLSLAVLGDDPGAIEVQVTDGAAEARATLAASGSTYEEP